MTNDSAVAAQPVLASILSHQRKSYVSTWVSACASDEKHVKTARQLLTGIKSLDDYLSGAFTYGGGIVSIANEGGRGSSFPSMVGLACAGEDTVKRSRCDIKSSLRQTSAISSHTHIPYSATPPPARPHRRKPSLRDRYHRRLLTHPPPSPPPGPASRLPRSAVRSG